MKSKKGAFDIEDIFAYLAFVAMVLFFLVLLMIRSGWGLPVLGKSADKEVLNSNALAVVEAREGLNFMNFLKQNVDIEGEEMTMSELLSRYYYGDKFMDVPADVKKAQKEKIMEKMNELYSERCIFLVLKNRGEEKEIEFTNDAEGCDTCFGLSERYNILDQDLIYTAILPSEYENGLSWLGVYVMDVSRLCKK